jgi:hypothetical protein
MGQKMIPIGNYPCEIEIDAGYAMSQYARRTFPLILSATELFQQTPEAKK